jgi:hypothetical protein
MTDEGQYKSRLRSLSLAHTLHPSSLLRVPQSHAFGTIRRSASTFIGFKKNPSAAHLVCLFQALPPNVNVPFLA